MSRSAEQLPRLLALVPYLLSHPGERVADVARLFGVTERRLRADLDLLFVCGLPGHGPGELIDVSYTGDRVMLSNADTIARPLRLTTEEALALVVALRTLAGVPGLPERDALDRALAKLEAAAASAAPTPAPDPTARVVVAVEVEERAVATVRDALQRGRRLHLSYHGAARDETTERDVDPMRLLLVEGRSYLEGWCRRAEGVRLFRLDRVVAVRVLHAPAEVPSHAQPRDLAAGLFTPSPRDAVITLDLSPAARWVADYYPCESVEETEGGGLRVRLRTPHTAWVRRLVLRLGPAASLLDPPELARQVRVDARTALAAYAAD